MSRELLNTLFVLTQGAYVHLEGETAKVEHEGKTIIQTPLHHLGGIVIFGNVMVSPHLMAKCASESRTVSFLSMNGKFLARVVGPVTGNVLLRKAQYDAFSNEKVRSSIARSIVAGKIHNCRSVLLRASRESSEPERKEILSTTARSLSEHLQKLKDCEDIDEIRGYEGQATADYFAVFNKMIRTQKTDFKFNGRNRHRAIE